MGCFLPVLNVAFVGSEGLARRLGKRGDVRDVLRKMLS